MGGSQKASEAQHDAGRGIQHFYTPKALQKAKKLRQNQTDAEGLLWHYLRNNQLGGYKCRRQQPIGNYIVDFYFAATKLIIELDGGQHAEKSRQKHDKKRDEFLKIQGHTILRFWNNDVFEKCDGVLQTIYNKLIELSR